MWYGFVAGGLAPPVGKRVVTASSLVLSSDYIWRLTMFALYNLEKQVSFAPMSPGFDPRSWHLNALGFQSKLASAGFSPGSLVFCLHLKLDQTDLKSNQRALLERSDAH